MPRALGNKIPSKLARMGKGADLQYHSSCTVTPCRYLTGFFQMSHRGYGMMNTNINITDITMVFCEYLHFLPVSPNGPTRASKEVELRHETSVIYLSSSFNHLCKQVFRTIHSLRVCSRQVGPLKQYTSIENIKKVLGYIENISRNGYTRLQEMHYESDMSASTVFSEVLRLRTCTTLTLPRPAPARNSYSRT